MSSSRFGATKTFRDLHRSVRFADVSVASVVPSLLVALLLSAAGLYFEREIVVFHQKIVQWTLVWGGVPAAQATGVITPLGHEVPDPALHFPGYAGNLVFPIATGAGTAVFLLTAYFSVRISRTLVLLILALLGASLLNLLNGGTFGTDARSFATIWLRFEFVTWISVPWLMAVFAGIVMPAGPAPVFWTVAPPCYAVLWSAMRLAFCIGVLNFTGPLLAPVLWFAMGAVADILYISVFYSFIAVHASSLRRREAGKWGF